MGLYKNDVRLNDSKAVIRLMARVLNALLKDKEEEGSMPVDRARAVIHGCSVMLKGFEVTDLQKRLEKMEENLEEVANGQQAK